MTRMQMKRKLAGELSGFHEFVEFFLLRVALKRGVTSRMELHCVSAKRFRTFNLFRLCVYKEADFNLFRGKGLNHLFQAPALSNDIKPAFRRQFLTLFRHKTHARRPDL